MWVGCGATLSSVFFAFRLKSDNGSTTLLVKIKRAKEGREGVKKDDEH
jgi:hypothetical protein